MTTRRQALRLVSVSAAALPALAASPSALAAQAAPAKGPFQLPPLPYAFDALEPHIDTMTMQIHHDRHHAAYVNNLNTAVAGDAKLSAMSAEELVKNLASLPEKVRTAIRNNGGGHVNHTLFWQTLSKTGGSPKGELAQAIDKKFGNLSALKDLLTKTALGVFGSGWAWLSLDEANALVVEPSPNQDGPFTAGHVPLLGIDVWEHAYYLKYQNRRADYLAAIFNVINWDFVSERYVKMKG